jgi:CRISPR/Cas system CSM-associated protein Csm2 small subunit
MIENIKDNKTIINYYMSRTLLDKEIEIKYKIITVENLIDLFQSIDLEYQKEVSQIIPLKEENEKFEKRIQEIDSQIDSIIHSDKIDNPKLNSLYKEKSTINDNIRSNKIVIAQHKMRLKCEISTKNETITFDDFISTIHSIQNEMVFEISILLHDYNDQKKISLKFSHNVGCYRNYISISGENTEWVRSTYDFMKNKVDTWKNQFGFHRLKIITMILLYSIPILFFYILVKMSTALGVFIWVIGVLLVISIFIPAVIPDKIAEVFPCIELQTGPKNLHLEEQKRNRILLILLSIVIPIVIAIITLFYPR